MTPWLLLPVLALTIAIPLAVWHERRAREAWEAAHSITVVLAIDLEPFLSSIRRLQDALNAVGQTADTQTWRAMQRFGAKVQFDTTPIWPRSES